MGNLFRLFRLGLRKLESVHDARRGKHADDSQMNCTYEQSVQLTPISRLHSVCDESMKAVLSSPDVLSVIFEHLGRPDGLLPHEISQYASVCKVWRQASREISLQVRFRVPLRPRQKQKLLTTEQQIGSLSFYESDTEVATILQDASFRSRQAKSLHSIWDVDCLDSNGWPLNLNAFPVLRKLFIRRSQKLGESPSSYFDSRIIAHLNSLETLSLRGYACMDLRFLPLSLKMLQVGPGLLMRSTAEEAAGDPEPLPGRWEERFVLGLPLRSSAKEAEAHSTAFPLGLQLHQVVINCGRGAFLDEPLKYYFSVAEQLTLFGQKLVVKEELQDPYSKLLKALEQSAVHQLVLDFDRVMLYKVAHGLQPRLSRSGMTAKELCTEFRAAGGSTFTFISQRGSLHEQSVYISRVC